MIKQLHSIILIIESAAYLQEQGYLIQTAEITFMKTGVQSAHDRNKT